MVVSTAAAKTEIPGPETRLFVGEVSMATVKVREAD
jgi:hypothetical protein